MKTKFVYNLKNVHNLGLLWPLYFRLIFCNSTFHSLSDIDECDKRNGPSGRCGINAECTNTPGGFGCQCKPGFSGNAYKQCLGECYHMIFYQQFISPCTLKPQFFFWFVLIECYILSHMETDEIYNLGSK